MFNNFQLRYLQTLNSIAAEHNSTIIFPMPINLANHLFKRWTGTKLFFYFSIIVEGTTKRAYKFLGEFDQMEEHTLKNVNNCWNTNIYFYSETSEVKL